jgi:hypothetical protein
MWTMLPMLLLWPGLCCLCAALWLLVLPGLCGDSMVRTMCLPMLASIVIVIVIVVVVVVVVVIVITNQDSTSSRLLPGSSYSCCMCNLHALVHKQCHPVHIMTAHEILQLWATIRGISFPVTNSPLSCIAHLNHCCLREHSWNVCLAPPVLSIALVVGKLRDLHTNQPIVINAIQPSSHCF